MSKEKMNNAMEARVRNFTIEFGGDQPIVKGELEVIANRKEGRWTTSYFFKGIVEQIDEAAPMPETFKIKVKKRG